MMEVKGRVKQAAKRALVRAAQAVCDDLVMPVDSGHLKNSTYVEEADEGLRATVVSNTPYARRQYFEPEQLDGRWFDVYLNGDFVSIFIF